MGNSIIPYTEQNQVKSDFIIPFWQDLYDRKYVQTPNLAVVRNSILFKYSPFHRLSDVQAGIIQEIIQDTDHNFVINGMAGTGKTVMLTNLAAALTKNQLFSKITFKYKQNTWRRQ